MTDCEVSPAAWNQFVAQAPSGDVLQCWEWGELKARAGWEPLHLCACDGTRLRATALVLKRRLPRTRRCLFYCPRGPVFDPADPQALVELIRTTRRAAREHGAIALKADPAITVDDEAALSALRACGLGPTRGGDSGFGGVQPKAVMKVDLRPSEDDLLQSFHSKWRYNVRLASRKGVVVRTGCQATTIDAFYDLLAVTARRDGFRIRSRQYFHDMHELIVSPGLGEFFMAYADGTPIAGALAFLLGEQCWYVYGASDNEHRELMPNHLVQWEAMRWAKARGCTVYDMRGVSPEVDGQPTEHHIAGLNRFKRGFGARYVEYIGDWDLVFSRLWYALFRRALPIVRRAPASGAAD
jgi:peptidoglycan pentaglycine glycine transferase (the first glycine)